MALVPKKRGTRQQIDPHLAIEAVVLAHRGRSLDEIGSILNEKMGRPDDYATDLGTSRAEGRRKLAREYIKRGKLLIRARIGELKKEMTERKKEMATIRAQMNEINEVRKSLRESSRSKSGGNPATSRIA